MSDSKMAAFLKDHPKMIGAMFALMLFLSSAGSAAANNAAIIAGP